MGRKTEISKSKRSGRARTAGAGGTQPGFSEVPTVFAPANEPAASRDTRRFQESVRLARTFAAIESPEDRHSLIEFAERLAAKPG